MTDNIMEKKSKRMSFNYFAPPISVSYYNNVHTNNFQTDFIRSIRKYVSLAFMSFISHNYIYAISINSKC